jgi:AraC family transcriptional regulator, L-rhamnose operon regulatory protein RhaS
MRRYIQHEPFNIYCFEADQWEHPVHKHTYYEIIFILKGKGEHSINGNSFFYQRGDVFLLGPEDYHEFKIMRRTEFCYIRFTESFFETSSWSGNKDLNRTLKLVLESSFQSRGSIVRSKGEKRKLEALLIVLREEYDERNNKGFTSMRDSLMRAILTILSRSIVKQALPLRKNVDETPLHDLLLYIRSNIYKPELLRLDLLSRQFNYAPTYLGIFFKKHTGESLKHYIDHYRIKLIESRLLYSQGTLAMIADEFGFTDESHLTKLFKKYAGLTPGNFRSNKGKKEKPKR